MYDYKSKKSVILIDKDTSIIVALNAVAHLSFSLGTFKKEDLGTSEHRLADNTTVAGITKYPHILKKATSQKIKNTLNSIDKEDEISIHVFTQEMLQTGHDLELSETLKATTFDKLHIYAAIIYGPSESVDKYTKKYSLLKTI